MTDVSQMIAGFGKRGTGNAGGGIGYGLQAAQMKRNNRLQDLAMEAEKQDRERKQAADQKKAQGEFMTGVVKTLDSVPEEQRPQVWAGAMQQAQSNGWAVDDREKEWHPNMLPALRGMFGVAAPGANDGKTSYQYGNTVMVKDGEGNHFFASQSRNPRTNQVETVFSGIGGEVAKPVGGVTVVDGMGLTPTELVQHKGEVSQATARNAEQGKIDTQLDNQEQLIRARVKEELATANAQDSTKRASAAFDQVAEINKSLPLYDEAIAAIDSGAETGRALKFLPSFSEATNRFENAANQLGLSVIGQTTFGALSEAELRMALETAVPDGMRPEALRGWLTDRRSAQVKLANELRKLGTFLQRGGTIGEWYAQQDQQQQPQPAPQVDQVASGGFKIISVEQ